MANLTLESASKILSARDILSTPGKYENIKVQTVNPYEGKFIVSLNAMSESVADDADMLLKEGEYDKACENNISASLRPTDYIPAKGEFVNVQLVSLFSNKLNRMELFVASLTPVKAVTATKRAFGTKAQAPSTDISAIGMSQVEDFSAPVKATVKA
jgi:hypothetical protein